MSRPCLSCFLRLVGKEFFRSCPYTSGVCTSIDTVLSFMPPLRQAGSGETFYLFLSASRWLVRSYDGAVGLAVSAVLSHVSHILLPINSVPNYAISRGPPDIPHCHLVSPAQFFGIGTFVSPDRVEWLHLYSSLALVSSCLQTAPSKPPSSACSRSSALTSALLRALAVQLKRSSELTAMLMRRQSLI